MLSVPNRNIYKSFEGAAEIFRGLQRFGKNFIATGAAEGQTIGLFHLDIIKGGNKQKTELIKVKAREQFQHKSPYPQWNYNTLKEG